MRTLLGEFLGTFIIVLIGCSTVAVAVLFGLLDLYGVAILFGAGVSLAIYSTRKLCPSHLNPAVSLAFLINGGIDLRTFLKFTISQLLGAIIGGLLVFSLFDQSISKFELAQGIIRGDVNSYHSAVMFGEYFPNPGFEKELNVSHSTAIFFEAMGTFILMTTIFHVQRIQSISKIPSPILIGLTVSLLILFIAPYTQGGFNPARDFGPRMVAYFAGWKSAALPSYPMSFITVYILGPSIGALIASILNKIKW